MTTKNKLASIQDRSSTIRILNHKKGSATRWAVSRNKLAETSFKKNESISNFDSTEIPAFQQILIEKIRSGYKPSIEGT